MYFDCRNCSSGALDVGRGLGKYPPFGSQQRGAKDLGNDLRKDDKGNGGEGNKGQRWRFNDGKDEA